jgi:hypothetical protein
MLGFAPDGAARSALEFLSPEVLTTLPIAAVCSLPVLPWLAGSLARTSAGLDARIRGRFESSVRLAATLGLLGMFFLSAIYLAASTHHPFIYFRF